MSNEYSGEYEEYTKEDLYRDMEGLRKAGIIDVTGIADDGQWLYSMTKEGKDLYEEMKQGDLKALLKVFERIAEIENEEND
jgi:DNA-binding MarR family transcriptional regulator